MGRGFFVVLLLMYTAGAAQERPLPALEPFLEEVRERLQTEHGRVAELWTRLRKPLDGIADGLPRTLSASDVNEFVNAYRIHIAFEEDTLGPLVAKWLDDSDRGALGRSMQARRAGR